MSGRLPKAALRREVRHGAILAAYRDGRPVAEICDCLRVSKTLVRTVTQRAGIARPRGRPRKRNSK